jgi:hypothetical protein
VRANLPSGCDIYLFYDLLSGRHIGRLGVRDERERVTILSRSSRQIQTSLLAWRIRPSELLRMKV